MASRRAARASTQQHRYAAERGESRSGMVFTPQIRTALVSSLGVVAVLVVVPGRAGELFPMYDPLPSTGVAWLSADTGLSNLLKHGERSEEGNGHVFYAPQPPLAEPFTVLVEGAQYIGAWLETQPMAGAMWATRSVRLALDNQLVFMRTQRSDGRLSHRVDCGQHKAKTCDPNASLPAAGPEPVYLQGLYMASPAVDVAWFMSCQPECGNFTTSNASQARAYLAEVASSLARYDAYLWATQKRLKLRWAA